MKPIPFFVPLSIICLVVGCSRTPSELRGLVPVTITVLYEGKALPAVRVALSTGQIVGVWSSGGVTNDQGVAVIESNLRTHTASGVPAGTYKITLVQSVQLPDELKPTQQELDGDVANAEVQRKRQVFIEAHTVVSEQWETAATSPVELVVEQGNPVQQTVDVAKY